MGEKMCGGELYDRIIMKESYNENEARNVSETLIAALGYCHSRRVAHRDLKPANLLMTDPEDDASIKIADFGFAKRVRKPKPLSTKCGTPQYVAPEVLAGKLYDTQADMWSIGIIIFTLLAGHPPFENDNLKALVKLIKKGEFEFEPHLWEHHSAQSKEFIRNMLQVDPDKRFDARKALMSDWIDADDDVLQEIDLSDVLKVFKKFNAKRKFKAAVNAVVAAKKMQLLIDFQKAGLDLNSGEVKALTEHQKEDETKIRQDNTHTHSNKRILLLNTHPEAYYTRTVCECCVCCIYIPIAVATIFLHIIHKREGVKIQVY